MAQGGRRLADGIPPRNGKGKRIKNSWQYHAAVEWPLWVLEMIPD
jgi:hypothetical protein